jgi:RNA recognition motif-containing protein
MSVRLFVGNLPYDATEEEIRAHFAPVGTLSYVFIPVDRETGKKRGFAFVEFSDEQHAQEAVRQFNNQPFKGRSLAVNEARAKEARPPGNFGSGSGFRPPAGARPSGPPPRMPGSGGFGSDPGLGEVPSRGDRPNRKFGPDARPARSRRQTFRPDGGKKPFKEKVGGQIFAPDDDDDMGQDIDIDNFATSEDKEQ